MAAATKNAFKKQACMVQDKSGASHLKSLEVSFWEAQQKAVPTDYRATVLRLQGYFMLASFWRRPSPLIQPQAEIQVKLKN